MRASRGDQKDHNLDEAGQRALQPQESKIPQLIEQHDGDRAHKQVATGSGHVYMLRCDR